MRGEGRRGEHSSLTFLSWSSLKMRMSDPSEPESSSPPSPAAVIDMLADIDPSSSSSSLRVSTRCETFSVRSNHERALYRRDTAVTHKTRSRQKLPSLDAR